MNNRLYDDNKIKVLTLYLLNELDQKLDYETISEIVVWDGSINYFVFTDCFHQLVESGAIKKEYADDGTLLFTISPAGKESLKEVEDSLIRFVKDKIMRSATRLLAFKRNGSTVSSTIEKDREGYRLTATIKNNQFDLMTVSMYLDNREEADLMEQGFNERAEQIYSGILALFSGDARFFG